MKRYEDMTADQRREEYAAVRKAYEAQKALGLKLNMARGKPSTEQLDMVTREMAQLTRPEDYLAGGLDTRNYGELAGIPEARALFAEILGLPGGAGVRRRQRQPAADVRRHLQGVYPWDAPQREAVGQAGDGEVALPCTGL